MKKTKSFTKNYQHTCSIKLQSKSQNSSNSKQDSKCHQYIYEKQIVKLNIHQSHSWVVSVGTKLVLMNLSEGLDDNKVLIKVQSEVLMYVQVCRTRR
jgi:hypothetical protein